MSDFGLLKLICQANLIEIDTRYFVRNEHIFVKQGLEYGSHVTQITGAQDSARATTVNEQFMFPLCWGKTQRESQPQFLLIIFPSQGPVQPLFLARVGIFHHRVLFETPSLPYSAAQIPPHGALTMTYIYTDTCLW